MPWIRRVSGCAALFVAVQLMGCTAPSIRPPTSMPVARARPEPAAARIVPAAIAANRAVAGKTHRDSPPRNGSSSTIVRAGYEPERSSLKDDSQPGDDPFADLEELPLEKLIAEVQGRNPSLQAALAAWAAAAERSPQAVALDDPVLQTMFAPPTFASSSSVQSSYTLGVAQRIPWNGKRELRGQIAEWEAAALSWSTAEVQLRLSVVTRMSYFNYYLAQREAELTERNISVVQDFRSTAKAKYEANLVSQQDLSLADLELAKLQQQRFELQQSRSIAVARINTLLHRRPDMALPAPPPRLVIGEDRLEATVLQDLALQQRPELSALAAKIQAEQNAVLLACKEYCPDFEFMGRYDAFWTDQVQRPQVGMNMNVPLNHRRRSAAVREAQFRVSKLTAEYDQQRDSIAEEVQVALSRVEANQRIAKLFEDQTLPAAEANLETARAGYEAGSLDFLRLMDARKQFIEQQIGYQRTLTEYHRNLAELERAVGKPISPTGLEPALAEPPGD